MKLHEITLSICLILKHYRPELLPEFKRYTMPSMKPGELEPFLEQHFPTGDWGTTRIVEVPMKLLHWIENDPCADATQGYCMCGSPVDGHGWGDGHSPVDQYDYCLELQRRKLNERSVLDLDDGGTGDSDPFGSPPQK